MHFYNEFMNILAEFFISTLRLLSILVLFCEQTTHCQIQY